MGYATTLGNWTVNESGKMGFHKDKAKYLHLIISTNGIPIDSYTVQAVKHLCQA